MTTTARVEESSGRAIVLVDQEPLRNALRRRCQSALAVLAKRRQQLGVFEREDKPAFTRWLAREFGSQLTAARELEAQIRTKQTLLQEVENEMRRVGCDAPTAYRRLRFWRDEPAPAHTQSPPPPDDYAQLSPEEKEAIFKNWLLEYFGINPEQMEATAYKTTFGNFRVHLFGDAASDETIFVFSAPEPPSRKMKETYRVLVRRLHPDRRGEGDARASALWHEVQKAYAARDLERMETLLAFTEIEAGELGARTSLFQMGAVRRELQQTWRALRQSLRAAAANEAWNFAARSAPETIRARVQQNLEQELERQRRTLEYLGRTIAELSSTRGDFGFSRRATEPIPNL